MIQKQENVMSSEFDENAVALQWSETEEDDEKRERRSSGSVSKNESGSALEKKQSAVNSGIQSRSGSSKRSGRLSAKDVMVFNDAPDLDNEEFWSTVPRNHLLGRFAQYRQMSMASISNLLDELETLQATNTRQIYSLKSQHQLHKLRWDEEREMLIEAVRSTEGDKKEAQNYAELAMQEIENFVSLMKLDEKESIDTTQPVSLDEELGLYNRLNQIKDYLINHNLLLNPISDIIDDLLRKCQLFKERSKISVPKFITMMDFHKSLKQKQNLRAIETQTDYEKATSQSKEVPPLDEDKDILFPEEDEKDVGKKSVAISASPTLVRIAFFNDTKPRHDQEMEGKGVTNKDLEIPSGMVDIEDRTGLNLIQHPVVTDYLQSYDQILTFKEQFLLILEELDKVDISDILHLRKLNPVSIRSQNRIIPQIEDIGKSVEKILQTSLQILERLLLPKKKREVKMNKEHKTQIVPSPRVKQLNPTTNISISSQLEHLQEDCNDMKRIMKLFKQSYQSKFGFINNLMTKLKQMFLFLINNQSRMIAGNEQSSGKNQKKMVNDPPILMKNEIPSIIPDYDSVSIYFNRRDLKRNTGRMQQAILENNFSEFLYEEAVEKMSQYMEIPSKQLYILVQKYLHKDAMQKISEAVKQNRNFTEDTLKILNKMEISIEKKQQGYRDIQTYLRNERILRAKELVDTLNKIEVESSILMIKPILFNKSKNVIKEIIDSKNIVDQVKDFKQNILKKSSRRGYDFSDNENQHIQNNSSTMEFPYHKIWNPDYMIDNIDNDPKILIESRLLEIDTNRMLLPLNSVSVPYSQGGLLGNEYVLPPQIAVRSYVAVAHPTLIDIDCSPQNSKTSSRMNTTLDGQSKSRMSRDLRKHAPLPPINPLENIHNNNADVLTQDIENKFDSENNSEYILTNNI